MSFTISLPDEFEAVLGSSVEEREQRAREGLALELYREGKISLRRMGELAGLGSDYWAAENFRAEHKAPVNYTQADLEMDRDAAALTRGASESGVNRSTPKRFSSKLRLSQIKGA